MNVIPYPTTSRIPTNSNNIYECRKDCENENTENVAVKRSKRLKEKINQTVSVEKDNYSEDEFVEDPYMDAGSEYCPSSDISDSCSNTSIASNMNTKLASQSKQTHMTLDYNLQSKTEEISQSDVVSRNTIMSEESNVETIKQYNEDSSSNITIISSTTDGNNPNFYIDFNDDPEIEIQQFNLCSDHNLSLTTNENVYQPRNNFIEMVSKYDDEVIQEVQYDELEVQDKESKNANKYQNSVTVTSCTKKDGKVVRDKGHACYFCQKIFCNNLARHFELKHSNESEVCRILAMPKNSKRRRDEFINLTRYGDFYYNCDILTINRGELILTRRPTIKTEQLLSYSDYGPCPECLGFFLKRHIWHHLKYKCTSKIKDSEPKTDSLGKGIIAESNAMLNGILRSNVSTSFITHVVNNFKNDNISSRCKEDQTIMRYGAFLYEKYSNTQSELIRQSMRQLGRLTLQMKTQGEIFQNLGEVLTPEKFDAIITATKVILKNIFYIF